MNWEYKIIEVRAKAKGFFSVSADLQAFEVYLNDMGRAGWELVHCQFPVLAGFQRGSGKAVFKRAK
ncbi:DUF4177 domain-containing protein [Neptunicella sp.]|uniref:DUF4177 domain-containing protein n=1 Tax=Neptunicella sp. TaxID=2125986 RepID=UPI003F68DD99